MICHCGNEMKKYQPYPDYHCVKCGNIIFVDEFGRYVPKARRCKACGVNGPCECGDNVPLRKTQLLKGARHE